MQRNDTNNELSEFYAESGSFGARENHKNDAHRFFNTTNPTTTNIGVKEEEASCGQQRQSSDNDNDDYSSDDSSSCSRISGFSDESGKEWKPRNKSINFWLQKQMHSGVNPRKLLSKILPSGTTLLAEDLHDMTLWRILASILQEPPRRQKLNHVNTLEDVSLCSFLITFCFLVGCEIRGLEGKFLS